MHNSAMAWRACGVDAAVTEHAYMRADRVPGGDDKVSEVSHRGMGRVGNDVGKGGSAAMADPA